MKIVDNIRARIEKLNRKHRNTMVLRKMQLKPDVIAKFLAAFEPVTQYRSKMVSTSRGAGSWRVAGAFGRWLSGKKYLARRHENGAETVYRAVPKRDTTVSHRQWKRRRSAAFRLAKAATCAA